MVVLLLFESESALNDEKTPPPYRVGRRGLKVDKVY
jgi:hypothetical protein